MAFGPIVCLHREGLTRVALAALLLALSAAPGRADGDLPDKPGQLIETRPPGPVPALTFTDINEQPANLDAYKGKPLIINLWATWCGPCIKEMPSLAKLAADFKGQGVAVVAISEDRGGKFVVDPFLKEHQIAGIPIYLDKTMSTGKVFKTTTVLPMTILVDAKGELVGRVYGDRDWDTAESKAEIAKLFGLKPPGG